MAKVDPKITALLLGMPKGESGGDDGGEEEADVGKDRELAAAKSVLAAISSKDPEALSAALREHYDACEAGESDE